MQVEQWAWKLYHRIPAQARAVGLHFDQFLRNLTRRLPLVMLQTPADSDGYKASVVVAGVQPWAQYLPRALLEGPFGCTQLGSVPLWHLPRTLRKMAPSASLVIARVDRTSARLLFSRDYLRVPDLVDLWLDIPEDLGLLYRGRRNSTLRNDLNRADRNGLRCEISHDEADVTDFYHRFHVPFVHERFGTLAWPHSLPFLRAHFREGGLIWATQNGQRIAGCVFAHENGIPTALALGTVGGDYTAVELGAYTAIFRALIEHVYRLGCSQINFGGSGSLLTQGSLRYKRKWGMRIAKRGSSLMLLVRWEHLDRCVLDLLTHSGLIFEKQGHLSAVSILECEQPATAEDVTNAYRFLSMPGLHRLYLCSHLGLEPGIDAPPDTRLIDLTELGRLDLLDLLTEQVHDL